MRSDGARVLLTGHGGDESLEATQVLPRDRRSPGPVEILGLHHLLEKERGFE